MLNKLMAQNPLEQNCKTNSVMESYITITYTKINLFKIGMRIIFSKFMTF